MPLPGTEILIDTADASMKHVEDSTQCLNYHTAIQVNTENLDGTPCIVLQHSLDNINFADLDRFDIDCSPIIWQKTRFAGHYIRVCYEPKDNTTGTVQIILGNKY